MPEIPEAKKIVPERHWFVNSAGMTMLRMKLGSFHQLAESNAERQARDVEIKEEFWLADREVTVGQFQEFIDDKRYPSADKPGGWKGADVRISPTPAHPVQQVNWFDAIMYCNWLSRREGLSPCYERTGEKQKDYQGKPTNDDVWRLIPGASGYRLPLEVEWEYACRAGTTSEFSSGSDEQLLESHARFRSSTAVACGDKLANGWGLFDMHGNVLEWCEELYDPMGAGRVLRGGSWGPGAANCRAACRNTITPAGRSTGGGLRLALSPSIQRAAEPGQAEASGGTEGVAEQRP